MAKILVVDDEAPIRLLCRVNLEAAGFEVIEAPDGVAGFERAREEQPDLILLDLMMPGPLGWEVAEWLLDDRVTGSTPIVLVTARRDFFDDAPGVCGIDVLLLPFNPTELPDLVRSLLIPPDDVQLRRKKLRGLMKRWRAGQS
jgi:two-component system, OmpR family, alkaline phosphatase synthesis response regulator PhoP